MTKSLTGYKKVCLYCSAPEYFTGLTELMRKHAPKAHLTVIRPAGSPWRGEEACTADVEIDEVFSVRSLARPVQLWRHVRSLRRERFDCLITQYESLRLRIFIVLVRPERAEMWMPMFGEREVPTTFFATLWDLARLRATGYGYILRALFHAVVPPVPSRVRRPKDDH